MRNQLHQRPNVCPVGQWERRESNSSLPPYQRGAKPLCYFPEVANEIGIEPTFFWSTASCISNLLLAQMVDLLGIEPRVCELQTHDVTVTLQAHEWCERRESNPRLLIITIFLLFHPKDFGNQRYYHCTTNAIVRRRMQTMGIEPTLQPWKGRVLVQYTTNAKCGCIIPSLSVLELMAVS